MAILLLSNPFWEGELLPGPCYTLLIKHLCPAPDNQEWTVVLKLLIYEKERSQLKYCGEKKNIKKYGRESFESSKRNPYQAKTDLSILLLSLIRAPATSS